MNTKSSSRKPENVSPVFGLRYLEEEAAEVNGVAGCNVLPELPPDDNGGGGGGNYPPPPTHYTTNCDYADYD
ncbi:MAG TPA: herpeto-tandem family RiPP [Herpetosiphonaceae bacterium]